MRASNTDEPGGAADCRAAFLAGHPRHVARRDTGEDADKERRAAASRNVV